MPVKNSTCVFGGGGGVRGRGGGVVMRPQQYFIKTKQHRHQLSSRENLTNPDKSARGFFFLHPTRFEPKQVVSASEIWLNSHL